MGEDQLGLVLRAHIYVEHELIEFIKQHNEPSAAKDRRYAARVERAINLGLPKTLAAPLKALGHIRNKFAHDLDASLTDSVVQNFYGTFDSVMKQAIQHSSRSQSKQSANSRHHFVVYVINVWGAVVSEVQRAKLECA